MTLLGAGANTSVSNLSFATAVGSLATVGCSNCLALGGSGGSGQTRVGINNSTPLADLHIIQQTDNNGDNARGIRLQRFFNGHQWRVFIDPTNNYIFQYDNALYSYIEPVNGEFVSPSDERLKKDISPLAGVLDKLLLLQPKTYRYTVNTDADRYSYGFLAQDVEQLFPEFVFSSENGIKGIAYSNFSVIAIKAIQEQQQQILAQQDQINNLEKKNQEQEQQFQQQLNLLIQRIEALEKK
jgi:hypothetical protein